MRYIMISVFVLALGVVAAEAVQSLYPYWLNGKESSCTPVNGKTVLTPEQMVDTGCVVSGAPMDGDGLMLDCRPVLGYGNTNAYFAFAKTRKVCRALFERIGK